MLYSKQSDTYLGNILPPWLKTSSISSGRLMHPTFLAKTSSTSLEPGFSVEEIVTGARAKAHKMVHTAMKVGSASESPFLYYTIYEIYFINYEIEICSCSLMFWNLLSPIIAIVPLHLKLKICLYKFGIAYIVSWCSCNYPKKYGIQGSIMWHLSLQIWM